MNIIPDNKRVPDSYNEIDDSGANYGLPAYRLPMQIIAPRIKAPSAWTASTPITVGTVIKPTSTNDDGHYYICITAGTTDALEPTWPGTSGSVTDFTVVWRELIDASEFIAIETPTRVFSADEVARYAGNGSIAHLMAKAAFDQYSDIELWINLVDDALAGNKAHASITLTGTATGPGVITIELGTQKIEAAIADGDTAASIATALDIACALNHDLPATSYIDPQATGTLEMQAKNAGLPGNELGKYDAVATKWEMVVTVTAPGINVGNEEWYNGATNPDITNALDASASGTFKLIAIPYRDTTNIAALEAHLNLVSDYDNCNGCRAWTALTSTVAAATTLAVVNSKRQHVVLKRGCKYISFEVAAAVAAMHAQTGHAALPLNHMQMVKCDASDISDRLTKTELNALLWAGVTPFNDDNTGKVRCVRSITTYMTNSAGSPDPYYLDTTTIANLDYTRESVKAADLAAFSQCVLRENHVDGEPSFVVTPEDVNSLHFNVCKQLEKNGNLQMVDFHKSKFRSVRSDTVAGRVECDIPVEVVQGLHIIANYFRVVSSVGQS